MTLRNTAAALTPEAPVPLQCQEAPTATGSRLAGLLYSENQLRHSVIKGEQSGQESDSSRMDGRQARSLDTTWIEK